MSELTPNEFDGTGPHLPVTPAEQRWFGLLVRASAIVGGFATLRQLTGTPHQQAEELLSEIECETAGIGRCGFCDTYVLEKELHGTGDGDDSACRACIQSWAEAREKCADAARHVDDGSTCPTCCTVGQGAE
jgi:hypothetical protein